MDEDLPSRIEAYWEDPEVESMPDRHLAELEAEMVAQHVTAGDKVLDLGCGDGSGSGPTRSRCSSYVGLDRSRTMLSRFAGKVPGVTLVRADLMHLPFKQADFTVVLSQRALINLPDRASQEKVLRCLPALLKPGGRLILCEAFTEGVERLNNLRRELNCEPIQARWHNCFLSRPLVAEALGSSLQLESESDFSLYYFLTRVVHQALVGKALPPWDSPINRLARQIAQSPNAPRFSGYSTLVLQVWRRPFVER